MSKRILAIVLMSCLLITCLFGCGGDTDEPGGGGGESAGPKTLVCGGTKGEDSLDPTFNYASWYDVRYGICETLFKLDDNLTPVEWLADSYENIDERTWKITIKDGISFSNGTALDAQAVADSLAYACATNIIIPENMKTATFTADGQELTIQTNDPCPAMIYDLTDPFFCIMDVNSGTDFATQPIGTGPYTVVDFAPKSIAHMKANENYWGGKPNIEEVEYQVIMDSDTLAMAVQNGEIQWAFEMTAENLTIFEGDDNYNIYSSPTARIVMAYFNFDNEHLSKVNVRRAISMAMDRQQMCEQLLGGSATPAYAVFPDSLPYGDSKLDFDEYDMDEAMELLEEEGYTLGSDGKLSFNGQPVSLQIVTGGSRAEIKLLADGVTSVLNSMGFDCQLVDAGDDPRVNLGPGDFDIGFYSRMTAPTGDSYTMLSSTFSSNETMGHANYGGYVNADVDRMLSELASAADSEERSQLAVDIQQQILDDAAVINFGHFNTFVVTATNVSNTMASPSEYYQLTHELDIN